MGRGGKLMNNWSGGGGGVTMNLIGDVEGINSIERYWQSRKKLRFPVA